MQTITWRAPVLCLIAALGLIALAQPVVADDDVKKKVMVKVIKCDGDDCKEMTKDFAEGDDASVFIGDDLHKKIVIRKLHCEGEDCEDSAGNHKIVFVGKDGNVKVMNGEGENVWINHECEGEDCSEHAGIRKMVFVGDDGDVQVMAGDGGHAWVSHSGSFGLGGGYLGVRLTELTPELREHFGVPSSSGVMVSKVMADSPAFKAGLEAGDIIASVDGESIGSGSALGKNIRGREAGEEVLLDVWRDGSARSITAAVEEHEGGGRHAKHMGDLHKKMRKIMIHCDSEDEDCGAEIDIDVAGFGGLDDFDCGGSDECDVKVECKGGGCTCTINGEDADCSGIPGVPGQ